MGDEDSNGMDAGYGTDNDQDPSWEYLAQHFDWEDDGTLDDCQGTV